jgi:hypothetical protein
LGRPLERDDGVDVVVDVDGVEDMVCVEIRGPVDWQSRNQWK